MCLVIFAHHAHPEYPLVVAANRDEFFHRPTQEAHPWPGNGGIIAGKDLQAGGTWLGITASGRFATVTNIRDPSQAEDKPRSRGELTLNFLAGELSPLEYADTLLPHFHEYAGFNLLVGDCDSLVYMNNHERIHRELEPGIYGVSNGLLNSDWPKVSHGRNQLQNLIGKPERLSVDTLVSMMDNRVQASDEELPSTGVPTELERKLSAAFIVNPDRDYGTRCSTAVVRHKAGSIHMLEQNYDAEGQAGGSHYFELHPSANPAAKG